MSWQPVNKPSRWRKMPKSEYHRAEAYLRAREKFCVAACARFLRMGDNRGRIWYLDGAGDEFSALLLHTHRSLFPVFDQNHRIPSPRFLNRFLGKVPVHAVQGLQKDADILERLMENYGYFASERNDYALMSLDDAPRPESLKSGPAGLVLRSPLPEDMEPLFALQAAYEQEEVLPENAVFNAAACRLNLQHIVSREYILVAELNDQLIGKINTSAESFTRYQIGGVYVRPDCRSRGIGLKMTASFVQNLLTQGKGLTLFVKKRNAAAGKVYRKVGFNVLEDYRISYY